MKKTELLSLLLLPFLFIGPRTLEAEAAHAPYQIPNGGFENGDLSGWQSFRLWKDEEGIAAFDESLVHGGTYFSNYPYNRDGDYQVGITSASVTWNQAEERMGHLRSSDFILGGSGWISFKLGGGKAPSFAYVSIRKTTDDLEVARFGNRWFNNTTEANRQYGGSGSDITNTEAFLFQYYFDLSSVTSVGTSLYIVLSDTSAYNWSILSADSFITYYENEPSYHENELAVNILPTILLAGSATASIPNGYFNVDLSDWTNVDGIFKLDGNTAISNQGGDAMLGVICSSAFKVTSDLDHIRFKWAGRLGFDKQIFVSIKEVGSNFEILRFVKRTNISSSFASGDLQNHMLTLTSLSYEKEYYLEFADNVTLSESEWAVSKFDDVRLITDEQYDTTYGGSSSGDNAEMVTGIPLSFLTSYQQDAASFASYFLEETAPYCATLDGANIEWSSLADEYATLSDDAKNYFVGPATDSEIVSARERYLFLINKYSILAANPFMVDSLGVVYDGSYDPILPPTTGGDNSKLALALMIILSAGMLAGTAFIYLYKKNRVY
jgi:hypothetical protein